MKKKFLIITVVICILASMLLTLSACGNKAILDPGSFTYTHVHVSDGVEGHCLDIDKWWDNSNGIEVRIADTNKGVFCSEGTYNLFENAASCPFCN